MKAISQKILFFIIAIICSYSFAINCNALNFNEVKNVRIWPSPENTRIVLDLENPAEYSLVNNNSNKTNKVIIILKNSEVKTNLDQIPLNNTRISQIKSFKKGANINDIKLEILLTEQLIPNIFALTPNQQYGHRLVIDLEIPSEEISIQDEENQKTNIKKENMQIEREEIIALFIQDAPKEQSKIEASKIENSQIKKSQQENSQIEKTKITKTISETKTDLKPVKVLPQSTTNKTFIVAIDPGHGGEDPGAIGKHGTREKDVVLSISRYLKKMIDATPNMKAVLIRNGDYYIALHERVARARKHRADLFISIHADAFHDKRAKGSSVFTLSERGASSAAARWLAEKENRSDLIGGVKLNDKNKILASVLLDLSQTKSKEYGFLAAKSILQSMSHISALHKGHVEQAGFAVLKSPDIPSLLVETEFISNHHGEYKLRNPYHQKQIAQAIYQGILNYDRKRPR